MKEMNNDVIKNFYNSVAGKYSALFCNELDARPLECKLLDMFLERINNDGIILDIGTGPGEIAGYLGKKRKNVIGIDLSDEMISYAKSNYPGVEFLVQDMTSLNFKNSSIMGITAFYAIVHFEYDRIDTALKEFYRVLKNGGILLVAFHNGNETVHCNDFHGIKAEIDFILLDPERVVKIIKDAGFKITERIVRYHYEGLVEGETDRTIIFAEK